MGADRARLLVLNHNGRELLADCLPSVLDAAAHAPVPCAVAVVDNASTDDSVSLVQGRWPSVEIIHAPNHGLASFNAVLEHCPEDVVLLLNNDVKLERDAVGPLVDAVRSDPEALFAAPRCWSFDQSFYEGMRTRVRMRRGLVQGCCRVPGYEAWIDKPGWTAASGPILAVDRRAFLDLGGFDPLFRPGRIEDLDFGYRVWMAGGRGLYVPASVAYHKGFGSFGPAFGAEGCDRLALRNTLLFCWKNLRGRRLAAHLGWLPARGLYELLRGRRATLAAVWEALGRWPELRAARRRLAARLDRSVWSARQEAFFQEFRW